MRRIEMAPTENPVLECCDHGVACFIRVFESNSLPKSWTGSRRVFFVLFNLMLLFACIAADWIFFARFPNLRSILLANNEHSTTMARIDGSPRPIFRSANSTVSSSEIFDAIRLAYFACLVFSLILLGTMQCFIHSFALWRATWRQNLVLAVEMIATIVQTCAPPILICLLFILTPLDSPLDSPNSSSRSSNSDQSIDRSASIRQICEWQLLSVGIAHSASIVVWQVIKSISLGLCCCGCFGCCLVAWPIYRSCSCESKHQRSKYRSSSAIVGGRNCTFSATVLDFMPPETDRGSWLAATKWCILTIWTFPTIVLGLCSSAILISIAITDRNFVYYRLWWRF